MSNELDKKSSSSINTSNGFKNKLVFKGEHELLSDEVKNSIRNLLINEHINHILGLHSSELHTIGVLNGLGIGMKVYLGIKSIYDKGDRFYHNFTHILSCISKLEEIKEELSTNEYNTLIVAFLFHDIIYDASAKGGLNEANSAKFSDYVLDYCGLNKCFIDEVSRLINLTNGHEVDLDDRVGKYMIDIDLSILGSENEVYDKYIAQVRNEYSVYSDEEYINGRLSFLEDFYKKRIFQTDLFYNKYEKQAKSNISREISQLKKSLTG